MTAPASTRTQRGSKLQVYLSRSESADWGDPDTRAEALAKFRKMALAKGRKYVAVYSVAGVQLEMVGV